MLGDAELLKFVPDGFFLLPQNAAKGALLGIFDVLLGEHISLGRWILPVLPKLPVLLVLLLAEDVLLAFDLVLLVHYLHDVLLQDLFLLDLLLPG